MFLLIIHCRSVKHAYDGTDSVRLNKYSKFINLKLYLVIAVHLLDLANNRDVFISTKKDKTK